MEGQEGKRKEEREKRKEYGSEASGQVEEKLETQICKEPDCKHSGEPQPIGNFQIHGPSGRLLGVCKACMGKKLKEGKKKKKMARSEDRPAVNKKSSSALGDTLQPGIKLPPVPRDPEEVQYYPYDMLDTMLDGLPEILETIKKMAYDQERTPIAQMRYLMKTDYRITGADIK